MGVSNKIIILSTCVALCIAQAQPPQYQYTIRSDNPTQQRAVPNTNQYQQKPQFQQRPQPSQQTVNYAPQPIPSQQYQHPAQLNTQYTPQPLQSIPQQSHQFSSFPQDDQYQKPIPAPAQFTSQPQYTQTLEYAPLKTFSTESPKTSGRPQHVNFRPQQKIVLQSPTVQTTSEPIDQFEQSNFQQNDQYSNSAPQQFTEQISQRFQPQEQVPVERIQIRKPSKINKVNFNQQSQQGTQQKFFEDEELIKEQNAAAKYAFSSAIQDDIQDGALQRQEVRDGLALKGMYSYSDGFFKRTVQYEADQNGYRVVGESSEPIGEGPAVNLNGKANIETNFDGNNHAYSITADDIVDLRKKKKPFQIVEQ